MSLKVVAAAVMTSDGVVHFISSPARHHHIVHALHKETDGHILIARGEQGFVLSNGTFADRVTAKKIAEEAKQIKEGCGKFPQLYSEDLW